MQTLADEILSTLPHYPSGARIQDLTSRLAADYPSVRMAFLRLEEEGRAKLCRRGRGGGFYLVPVDYPGRICVICKREYDPAKNGKKQRTCSLSCGATLSWADPVKRANRIKGIKACSFRPDVMSRRLKAMRQPKARAKLAESVRKSWQDPEIRARRLNGIDKAWKDRKQRERVSRQSSKRWANPEYRKKTSAAMRGKRRRRSPGEIGPRPGDGPRLRRKAALTNSCEHHA